MKKAEILKNYRVDKLDDSTIFIQNTHFNFSYTIADNVVKNELKGMYTYFGGLQCNYEKGTESYNILEKWLIEICKALLNIK